MATLASIAVALVFTLGVSLIFGFKYRVITTDSMTPKMPVGTLIIENKVAYSELKVGDVITYTRAYENNIKVTHRIVDITEDNVLIVRGDNESHTQIDYVNSGNYVGKVLISLPQIKIFFDWVANNMFLILYDIVVIAVAYQILLT